MELGVAEGCSIIAASTFFTSRSAIGRSTEEDDDDDNDDDDDEVLVFVGLVSLPLVLLLYHYTCLCAPSPAYARLCPSIGSYGSLYDTHEYIKLIISYAINLCRIIVAHFLEHINIQMVIITYNAYVRLCAPISAYVCLCASLSSYKLFGSVTR